MAFAVDALKDPYERKARVTPGLLVVLPIIVPMLCVYGAKNPLLTAVTTALGGCGAIYALASVARGRGKRLEEKLVKSWGGLPTTMALRHRDNFLDSVSKARYHEAFRRKLGIEMPTPDDERTDPVKADDTYIGATKRLRELTRNDRHLLMKENIAYGFHRNMLSMKPAGILTCMIGLLYGLLIGKVVGFTPPYLILKNFPNLGLAAGLTLAVSLTLLTTWLFYFNEDAVRRAGFSYAERLFERLPTLKASMPANQAKRAGS